MEEKTVDGDRVDGQVFNTLLDYINYKTRKLCPKIQKKKQPKLGLPLIYSIYKLRLISYASNFNTPRP